MHNADSSKHYASLLLEYASRKGNRLGLSMAHMRFGDNYRLLGDYVEAIDSYLKSLEFADYEIEKGALYITIGDVYSIVGSHSSSIQYYLLAIEIFSSKTDVLSRKQLASAFINMGDELFNNGQFDSALNCFHRSLVISKKNDFTPQIAYNLGNIGLVLAEKEEFDSAELKISQASAIMEEIGDMYPISVYNTYLADIYLRKGELDRALEFANRSLNIGIDLGYKEQIRDASMKLAELYERNGDYKKAYSFQKQYISLRDSLNSEQVIQEIADLRREFEVSQKQAEVDVLTAQRQTQRVIGFSLMGGLGLVLALAIIQYRNANQRKKTNQMLREQKSKLEELNQTKDRFFSIISHDLRGPVNAFHGVSRMIKFFVKQKEMGQLEELAEDIDQSVDRLSSLLDNLLNWAVQQQGNFPYVPEKLDVGEMADDLVKTFKTMAESKQINLSSKVGEEILAWADRNTTMTIIRNLVSNALKFTPQKGSVTIYARSLEDSLVIEVSDTGVGIPEEKINDLFKLQAKKSTWGTAGEKGLGLGLQLVQEFVELNQGKIEVQSSSESGTTFKVWLPLFEAVDIAQEV